MTDAFVWDFNTPSQRLADFTETKNLLQEIHEEIVKNDGALQYSHHVRCTPLASNFLYCYAIEFDARRV